MIESRRRAYLEAMGFDIWSTRLHDPDANRLVLRPGEGDTLLICDSAEHAAGPFACDVSRALGGGAVWAWPDPEGRPESTPLEEAVGQYLFTRVVLFGARPGMRLFKGEVPMVVGSARVLVAESLEILAANGVAKQTFWKQVSGKDGSRA